MKKQTKAEKKISKVMKEWKAGKLKSSNGKGIKSQKQAIAVALSESKKVSSKKK